MSLFSSGGGGGGYCLTSWERLFGSNEGDQARVETLQIVGKPLLITQHLKAISKIWQTPELLWMSLSVSQDVQKPRLLTGSNSLAVFPFSSSRQIFHVCVELLSLSGCGAYQSQPPILLDTAKRFGSVFLRFTPRFVPRLIAGGIQTADRTCFKTGFWLRTPATKESMVSFILECAWPVLTPQPRS